MTVTMRFLASSILACALAIASCAAGPIVPPPRILITPALAFCVPVTAVSVEILGS